jgi:hypothetical protein
MPGGQSSKHTGLNGAELENLVLGLINTEAPALRPYLTYTRYKDGIGITVLAPDAVRLFEAFEEAFLKAVAERRANIQRENFEEMLEAAEILARQHCYTDPQTLITSSLALSANAEMLGLLAENGRFSITAKRGRSVAGYWPENNPENQK